MQVRNYLRGHCVDARLWFDLSVNAPAHILPTTLRQARKARRLSQLELSLRMGVSQRHVSFVESGRAKPSRALLMSWLQELDAPLVVRNAAMLQAGYAPAYSADPLGGPSLAQANEALVRLLRAHDPMLTLAAGIIARLLAKVMPISSQHSSAHMSSLTMWTGQIG